MARCIAARRDLRHVDNRPDTGVDGALGELRGRLHQAWPDRINEVRPVDALERASDGIEIQQVADEDLRAVLGKRFGPLVPAVNEGRARSAPCPAAAWRQRRRWRRW